MRRLFRAQYDRQLAGVCGGIGQYFNIDPTLVRIGVVVLALVTAFFPVLIGYIIAAAIVPNEEDLD
ncbi:PspC domain-containing protein [Halalkalibacterium halodurans]|jgi:phage shock protein C|uniref:BH3592 protein n=2 Tax=Halalkalibacterium halodurans TaxID=86665 RepID=Q9K6Y2_HALH5|nr:PspC domain-containing protein [Halalkalibacterium halodurans]MDY7224069.1 PspC domain-containing protein [Halalkalibacterium halodurans]MDY7243354.1 PspC domain-containing protein [Halalkalibacterium halodurans]MED3647551.1 PspC domain-containing protein [Halalkalibacterium halodurans]MED4081904.1 PspC domain-containing protein [Halalkalibacterium halodurans]MED4083715.1 PspC domain-containing protein [Halalkalibacterium halodurans]